MSIFQLTQRHIDEHHFIERYLTDRLEPAERDAFEAYYLVHPEVLQQMQAVAGLELGLQQLRASNELQPLLAPRRSGPLRGWARAATVLLAITCGVGLWLGQRHTPDIVAAASPAQLANRDGRPLMLHATYDIQRTRDNVDAVVTLSPGPGVIRLRIRAEIVPAPATYQVALITAPETGARSEIARVAGLVASADGFIELFVSSQALSVGTYELEVRDANHAEAAAQVLLLAVAAG